MTDEHYLDLLEGCRRWTQAACTSLSPVLHRRQQQGFVRECHGDLHLANMVWLEKKPLLFDCIEFSESLRRIDVINDIAFLLMDLDDRAETEFGWVFLNHYMKITGDYAGMALLRFYKVYRAMVRAKVNYLRLAQARTEGGDTAPVKKLAQSYLDLAADSIKEETPRLLLTHGLSGSGKTSFVEALAPRLRAICLHSDEERRRQHDLDRTISSGSAIGDGIYSAESSQLTYRHLHDLARQLLSFGYNVIVDATFLKVENRRMMVVMAEELNVPWFILDFKVEPAELRRRIKKRMAGSATVSEATIPVLDYQLERAEPLGQEETARAIEVTATSTAESVVDAIAASADRE